jgi:hypothetical protein
MIEYRITRQAVDGQESWTAVPGAPARELELHSPAGEEWSLHTFEHGQDQVVAVWTRQKRPHAMSAVYVNSEAPASAEQSPVKTMADIPVPHS